MEEWEFHWSIVNMTRKGARCLTGGGEKQEEDEYGEEEGEKIRNRRRDKKKKKRGEKGRGKRNREVPDQ